MWARPGAGLTCMRPLIASIWERNVGIIDDISKQLDRIPIWKRLQTLPSETDELKARVSVLEEKLGGKWPADVCRACGERALRLASTGGPDQKGNIEEVWSCGACGVVDLRTI
jgi:hypothetical protein